MIEAEDCGAVGYQFLECDDGGVGVAGLPTPPRKAVAGREGVGVISSKDASSGHDESLERGDGTCGVVRGRSPQGYFVLGGERFMVVRA